MELAMIEIIKLMTQAPVFSTGMSALLIYLIFDKIKTFFLLRDYKNKETMEKFVADKINQCEIRIKNYIDDKFKTLHNGL